MTENDLIDKYIGPNPYRPGVSESRVKAYGVPVWALVGHLEAVHGDITRVASDYRLPREAVEAALAYYRLHRGAIDARLEENAS